MPKIIENGDFGSAPPPEPLGKAVPREPQSPPQSRFPGPGGPGPGREHAPGPQWEQGPQPHGPGSHGPGPPTRGAPTRGAPPRGPPVEAKGKPRLRDTAPPRPEQRREHMRREQVWRGPDRRLPENVRAAHGPWPEEPELIWPERERGYARQPLRPRDPRDARDWDRPEPIWPEHERGYARPAPGPRDPRRGPHRDPRDWGRAPRDWPGRPDWDWGPRQAWAPREWERSGPDPDRAWDRWGPYGPWPWDYDAAERTMEPPRPAPDWDAARLVEFLVDHLEQHGTTVVARLGQAVPKPGLAHLRAMHLPLRSFLTAFSRLFVLLDGGAGGSVELCAAALRRVREPLLGLDQDLCEVVEACANQLREGPKTLTELGTAAAPLRQVLAKRKLRLKAVLMLAPKRVEITEHEDLDEVTAQLSYADYEAW